MKQRGLDTKLLPPAIVVVLTLLSAWYGHTRLGEEQRLLDNAQRVAAGEISRIRVERLALAADLQYLDDNRVAADEMEAAGFLRTQDRLELSQAVETVGISHQFNRIRVSVAPEQELLDMPFSNQAIALVSTPVSIILDAASEKDVLAFLNELPGLFTGVAIVETAQLRRVGGHDGGGAGQAERGARPTVMTAQIALRWQTIRPMLNGSGLTTVAQ